MSRCSVQHGNGGLIVHTPYHAGFVAAIKSLPASARRYNQNDKSWIIDPQYGGEIVNWIAQFFGELILLPSIATDTPREETRVLEVYYVGRCKPREDGERSAYGWANGEWSVIFPERVLRNWFEGFSQSEQQQATTLYAILGVKRTVDSEAVKGAYRRLAKQWHPDVCREPDAAERFIRIQEAYQILSDPNKRARYDAGLALEASIQKTKNINNLSYAIDDYSPPLRCGYILAEGREIVGRFVINKILAWDDITDSHGRTLVTSWPKDAQTFMKNWV